MGSSSLFSGICFPWEALGTWLEWIKGGGGGGVVPEGDGDVWDDRGGGVREGGGVTLGSGLFCATGVCTKKKYLHIGTKTTVYNK